jgi:hypothetical protein
MKKGNKKKLSRFTISMDEEHERILIKYCTSEKVNKSLMVRKLILAYENMQKGGYIYPLGEGSK